MIRNSSQSKSSVFATASMVKIAMLAGLGTVLMLLDFPLPIFPSFLKFDLSDAPAVIGAFAMGPAAGVMIELVKNILKLMVRTNTGGVGEVANFLVGTAYVLPLALVYKKWPTKKGVVCGSVLATFSGAIIAGLLNYFVLIPAYAVILGYPVDAFVGIAAKINSAVVDLRTLVVFAVVPFNLVKGVVVTLSGLGLFKVLQPLFKKY